MKRNVLKRSSSTIFTSVGFRFFVKGKISVSTHNILKQSLRHLSDQSAFITFGGVGGEDLVGSRGGKEGRSVVANR